MLTLYVAASGRGAMAEFLRRAPELIDFQDDLNIILYELDLDVRGECLDLRADSSRNNVGISLDRLVSSEGDELTRYSECRALARDAVAHSLTGIFFPSAAATWSGAWNLVVYGGKASAGWDCLGHREVSRPRLTVADVRPLAFS